MKVEVEGPAEVELRRLERDLKTDADQVVSDALGLYVRIVEHAGKGGRIVFAHPSGDQALILPPKVKEPRPFPRAPDVSDQVVRMIYSVGALAILALLAAVGSMLRGCT